MGGLLKKITYGLIILGILLSPVSLSVDISDLAVNITPQVALAEEGGIIPTVKDIGLALVNSLYKAQISLLQLIFTIVAFIVYLAGVILNFAVFLTISSMGQSIDLLGTLISDTWTIFRDLANVAFVFVLLYAGIQTMLGNAGSSVKNIIKNVVIAAVFVNFSLFFTQVAIDASNALSLAVYNQTINTTQTREVSNWSEEDPDDLTSGVSNLSGAGLAGAYINAMKLTTVLADYEGSVSGELEYVENSTLPIRILFNIIMMALAGVILLVSGLVLFVRFVYLVFLMILSPLAFVGIILPSLKSSLTDRWWSKLKYHLIYPPVFFLFVLISIRALEAVNNSFSNLFLENAGLASATNTFQAVILTLLFSMMMSIFFLGIPILAAKAAGEKGDTLLSKAYNTARGSIARNTVGRAAKGFEGSKFVKNSTLMNSTLMRDIRGSTTGKMANQKFFGTRSFKEAGEESKKSKTLQAGASIRNKIDKLGSKPLSGDDLETAKTWVRGLRGDELKAEIGNIKKNPQLANMLTSNQLEYLEKDDSVSYEDIQETYTSKEKYHTKNDYSEVNNMKPEEVAKLKNIFKSRDEKGNPIEQFSREAIQNVGLKQIQNSINKMDADDRDANQKLLEEFIKNASSDTLKTKDKDGKEIEIKDKNGNPISHAKLVKDAVSKLKNEDLVNIPLAQIIQNKDTSDVIDERAVAQIMEKGSLGVRKSVEEAIKSQPNHPAQGYFTKGPASSGVDKEIIIEIPKGYTGGSRDKNANN